MKRLKISSAIEILARNPSLGRLGKHERLSTQNFDQRTTNPRASKARVVSFDTLLAMNILNI